jgi:hypothetical protein
MGDRSRDASALLGMEGFVVLSQTEEDGECWVLVETTRDVAGWGSPRRMDTESRCKLSI